MTKNRKNKSNARALAAHTGQSYRAARGNQVPSLTTMGLTSDEADAWVKSLSEPGLHVIAGKTASGKSTAIASVARELVRFGYSVSANNGPVLDIPGVEYVDNDRFARGYDTCDVYFVDDVNLATEKTWFKYLNTADMHRSVVITTHANGLPEAISSLHVAQWRRVWEAYVERGQGLLPLDSLVDGSLSSATLSLLSREGDTISLMHRSASNLD